MTRPPRWLSLPPVLPRCLPAAGGCAWGGCPRPCADLYQPHHQPGVCRQGEHSALTCPLTSSQQRLGSGADPSSGRKGAGIRAPGLTTGENQCLKMVPGPVTQATPRNPGQPAPRPQIQAEMGSDCEGQPLMQVAEDLVPEWPLRVGRGQGCYQS